MGWTAQQERTLILADDRQNQQSQRILPPSRSGSIAFEQPGIDLIGHLAHRRGEWARRLIERTCCVVGQLHELGGGKSSVARKHQVNDEVVTLTSSCRLARWCEGQQARHLSQLLSVISMNGENIQVK